jgi:hypothetical protein
MRTIEVLLKKASVDPRFRERLLESPSAAAASLGLPLTPVEEAVLASVPRGELARMIERVRVPAEQRSVFRGVAAAAMLALVAGTAAMGCRPPPAAPSAARPPALERNEPIEWHPAIAIAGAVLFPLDGLPDVGEEE